MATYKSPKMPKIKVYKAPSLPKAKVPKLAPARAPKPYPISIPKAKIPNPTLTKVGRMRLPAAPNAATAKVNKTIYARQYRSYNPISALKRLFGR